MFEKYLQFMGPSTSPHFGKKFYRKGTIGTESRIPRNHTARIEAAKQKRLMHWTGQRTESTSKAA